MVAVNGGTFIGADLPFGGRGQSGIGREWGVAGFEEFLELKSVGVGAAAGVTASVDAHSHLFPTAWAPRGRMPPDMFDVERQLERMESGGRRHVLSSLIHTSGTATSTVGDIAQTREYNDFAAELARDHRGTVLGLATVTPWRGDEHLVEARRAVAEARTRRVRRGRRATRGATSTPSRPRSGSSPSGLGVPVFVHPGGTSSATS